MKIFFRSLLYTLGIGIIGWIAYLILSTHLSLLLYDYKLTFYNHEIDTLLRNEVIKNCKIKFVYKSGKHGSIYIASIDSLINFSVIEVDNFRNINLNRIETEYTDKIDPSQDKTYKVIFLEKYPILELALNPPESDYLKIFFEKQTKIDSTILKNQYFYMKGDFSAVAFGNTQNCNIVSFLRKQNNEILILKNRNKLAFVVQSIQQKSILEIIDIERLEHH